MRSTIFVFAGQHEGDVSPSRLTGAILPEPPRGLP